MISRQTWLGGPLIVATVPGGFVLPAPFPGPRMLRLTISGGTGIAVKMPDARKCQRGWPIYMVNGITQFQDNLGGAIDGVVSAGSSVWAFIGLAANGTQAGTWYVLELITLAPG